MNSISKNDIDVYLDIGEKIDIRIRKLLMLRDIVPFISGWFIKDNKLFVNYKNEYSKEINYKGEYKDLKYLTIYWDLDYFLSSDREKEWELYEKIKKERDNLGD